jgi:membrane protease YdiL (CAAX protease family)
MTKESSSSRFGSLKPYWQGLIFLFEPKPPAGYGAKSGMKLLFIFVVLEWVIGPRLALFSFLHIPIPETSIRIFSLLVFALALVRFGAGIPLREIGLYSGNVWTKMESWYFIEIFIITNVIFSVADFSELEILKNHPGIWESASFLFIATIAWGFYQELIYRGILQTELVRRWGTAAGILASNLFFTFGPLHFYHFHLAEGNPSHLWVFAAIFAIGLYFGLAFKRSGNLWIIGLLHGVGDCYLDALGHLLNPARGH